MTTPTPVQLPLTREQVLEIAANWWRCPGEGVEVLLRDLGLAYAEPALEPLPESWWPAKLVVRRGDHARLLRAADDEDWYFALSTPDHLDEAAVAEEARRRWSRCAELEAEADRLGDNAAALVATLAERTRERDEAKREWQAWRETAEAVACQRNAAKGYASRLSLALAEANRLHEHESQCAATFQEELFAARQEAAELRRRCEWAATVAQRRADLSSHGMDDLLPKVLRGEVAAFDKEPSDA